jgi:hypothetical protein
MALFQPNRNPTSRELRWFAGLWFPAFCGGLGLWLLRHQHPDAAAAWWIVTAILALAGLVSPRAIRPVYRFLIRVTFPIGWIVSHLVVAAAYFLVITPIGIVMRLWHDPMRRTFDRSARSYWIDCKPAERDRYFRQT